MRFAEEFRDLLQMFLFKHIQLHLSQLGLLVYLERSILIWNALGIY